MKKCSRILLALFVSIVILYSNNSIIYAQIRPLTDIFSYEDYLTKDYSIYSNKKVIGKYYKVDFWGHRMVINYGNISLKAYKIEDFYPNTMVGTVSSITITTNLSYTLETRTTASAQVKVGITEMIDASVKLSDIASVGASTSLTTEYGFGIEAMYASTLQKDYSVESTYDLTKIPSDKITFSISRVAIFLEFEVNSSYTEEDRWLVGWTKLSNTEKINYKSRYYIGDVVTFCYNDNTFGNTLIGLYELQTVKDY